MSAPAMPSIQSVRDSHRGVIVTVTGLTAALAMTVTLAQSASSTAADPALEARVKALSTELRCLVCQNQTVADSDAPVARDLRDQVRTQLAAGKSEEEVKQYMTDRFGDFVLYKPPLRQPPSPLWLGPFAVLLFAAFLLTRRLRQSAPDRQRRAQRRRACLRPRAAGRHSKLIRQPGCQRNPATYPS